MTSNARTANILPRRLAAAALAVAVLGVGAACANAQTSGSEASPSGTTATSAARSPSLPAALVRAPHGALPGDHVHGVTRGRDGQVLLATHDGLYAGGTDGWVKRSPTIDLMGFTIGSEGSFLASGHPGDGSDLPSPVGLISSTDGGATWQHLSRGGQSDFHALSAGGGLVVGFDGALRISRDGKDWTQQELPEAPYSLAVNTTGDRMVATTKSGTLTTKDSGKSWQSADGPTQPVVAAFADASTAYGITAQGSILVSRDSGHTWTQTGATAAAPIAFSVVAGATPEILVATEAGVQSSRDAGKTVSPA